MRTYRATIAFNSWNVRYRFFEAEDKSAVVAMRPKLCKWVEEEELDVARRNALDPADVPDARVIVDEVESKFFSRSPEDVNVITPDVDEFDRPEDLPTGYDSRIFVQKVARLIQGPDDEARTFDDAIETLGNLITEAKKLCGSV